MIEEYGHKIPLILAPPKDRILTAEEESIIHSILISCERTADLCRRILAKNKTNTSEQKE